MSAIRKIKDETRSQGDGNIARGEAKCYITIKAKRRVYFRIAQVRRCFK